MKYLKEINTILLNIFLYLAIICLLSYLINFNKNKYDLNQDKSVNSGDIVILRNYILNQN